MHNIVYNCIVGPKPMEEFYTVYQTAVFLKVHPLTVRRYLKMGKLKAYRVGGNIRILLVDIKSFTQNFAPQTKPPKNFNNSKDRVFNFGDPLLSLKGRGLNATKLGNGK